MVPNKQRKNEKYASAKPQAEAIAKAGQQDSAVGAWEIDSPTGIDALDGKKVGLAAKYISIKPGTFQMGSPRDQAGRSADEVSHSVTLTHGYAMQATPVTQQQYFLVMGKNPSHFKAREHGDANSFMVINGQSMNATHPVEMVPWFEGIEYMNKLSELRGLKPAYLIERNAYGGIKDVKVNGPNIYETEGYRYPTEAEWEYAARAGTPAAFPYSFGHNDIKDLDNHGWHSGNSGQRTHAVASKKANPWGLYDMHGNVGEWTQDWYDQNYPSGSVKDPVGPTKQGSRRVIRGGAWNNDVWRLSSAYRCNGVPDDRWNSVGLRPVRSIR